MTVGRGYQQEGTVFRARAARLAHLCNGEVRCRDVEKRAHLGSDVTTHRGTPVGAALCWKGQEALEVGLWASVLPSDRRHNLPARLRMSEFEGLQGWTDASQCALRTVPVHRFGGHLTALAARGNGRCMWTRVSATLEVWEFGTAPTARSAGLRPSSDSGGEPVRSLEDSNNVRWRERYEEASSHSVHTTTWVEFPRPRLSRHMGL